MDYHGTNRIFHILTPLDPERVVSMRTAGIVLLLLLFLGIVTTSPALHAAWQTNGNIVCGEDYLQQRPKIISDGAGGAYVAWEDRRNSNQDIYVQRMDGSGIPYWTENGIMLTGSGDYDIVDIVPDGTGGVIIVWYTQRNSLYAQRLDSDGTKLWAGDSHGGVKFEDTPGDPQEAVAAPDGAGGVLVAWRDNRSGPYDLYAQKLDSGGNEIWTTDGVTVSAAAGDEEHPCIISDGMGGAFVAFTSWLSGNADVYVQRVYASGNVWITNGRALSSNFFNQDRPAICSDGAGGAIVTWQSNDSGDSNVYAAKINGAGTVEWPAGGIFVSTHPDHQMNPDILADGYGGAYIVWEDDRLFGWKIFGMSIDSYGTSLWTTNGIQICMEDYDQLSPKLLPCNGGAIAVWRDDRGYGGLAAQKINAGGGLLWSDYGVMVISGNTDFGDYDSASDGAGGLVATISDYRGISGMDIYAQSRNSWGRVSSAEPDITGITDVPDDQGGQVRITIARSDRDTLGLALEPVSRYNIWQRVDEPAPLQSIVESGLAIIESDDGRFLVTAPTAVLPGGTWELIGSFDATNTDEYQYRATTLADSSASGTPYSVYIVSAHTTNPDVWFVSEPDSGYSVDNLAPAIPMNLAGDQSIIPEGLELTWDPNTENDLAGYHVYRGLSSDFVPGPGNLIASPIDPYTFDDEWQWDSDYYYKVSAVDDHDNESPHALLMPDDVTGEDPPTVPLASYLEQNFPNPFNPVTSISFGIASSEHIKLRIYDAAGRLVRTLMNETKDAGHYTIDWNGFSDDGRQVASGVYFYKLTAGIFRETRKMILLR
jgi:hypothetical protein